MIHRHPPVWLSTVAALAVVTAASASACSDQTGNTSDGSSDVVSDGLNDDSGSDVNTDAEDVPEVDAVEPDVDDAGDAMDTDGTDDSTDVTDVETVGPEDADAETGCADGLTECGDECVDTSSDDDHCGTCGKACTGGKTCQDSDCACPDGLTECSGVCVDLTSDPNNCGACGTPAAAEACNGVDDDCNGQTDDGVTPPGDTCESSNVYGTCTGEWSCGGEAGWTCGAPTPAPDVCDAVDNDCNGVTDDSFVNQATGQYELDEFCGDCNTDCTAIFAVDNAHGVCDASGGAPTCQMVCCTIGDPNPACDGYDYTDDDGETSTGCETQQTQPCTGFADCPDGQFCDVDTCKPNEVGGPCESDTNCAAGDVCVGGICGCVGDQYAAEAVPPNVLIVLDRSGSMDNSGGGGMSKWEIALDAVETITQAYEDTLRFGIALFPGTSATGSGTGSCEAGAVFVDPALLTAADIKDVMDTSNTVYTDTPTAETMAALLDYPGLEDPTRGNYIILITDGESTCDDNPENNVGDLLNETPSIQTYVIGFGSGVDPDELNAMAVAGGTDLPGDTKYYEASNASSLGDALATIAGNVLSCDYLLSDVPDDPSELLIYFDGDQQPLDPSQTDGWDYNAGTNQITFFGPACQSLLDGVVTDLVIIYGCPDPVIIGGGQ